MAPWFPASELFLQRLGRERRVQREKIVLHFKVIVPNHSAFRKRNPTGRIIAVWQSKARVGAASQRLISSGRSFWIADAHRDDGKRFVVHADEKLTAFLELESAIRSGTTPRIVEGVKLKLDKLSRTI